MYTVYVLNMNNIDEIALINLVRKYPLLYDLSSPLYNEQQKKDEAWNEIAILMSATAYDCKTKWTRLRDNYRKALIVRNKNPIHGKNRAVKYEKELSFLNEKFSLTPRKKFKAAIENMEFKSLGNNSQEFQQQPKEKMPGIESKGSQNTESNLIPKKPGTSKSVHEINTFFESIAETVKTLPRKVQVQLKRQIFTLVNDAEASLLDNKNDTNTIIYYAALPTTSSPMINNSDGVIGSSEANEFFTSIENPPELMRNVEIKQEMLMNHIEVKEENI